MKSKRIIIILVAIIIVLLAGGIVAAAQILKLQKANNTNNNLSLSISDELSPGSSNLVVGEDTRNMQQAVNEKVQEGMIVVKMTGEWIFTDGCTTSNAYLANSERNSYPMICLIELADTGEVILTTPEMPVGSCIENFGLEKKLDPGVYDINIYHCMMKDGKIFNKLSTASQITVQ